MWLAGGTSSDAILFLLLWGTWAVWRWAQKVRASWGKRAAEREAAVLPSLSNATFFESETDSPQKVSTQPA